MIGADSEAPRTGSLSKKCHIVPRGQINADRTVSVQLPDDMQLPADIQIGHYDAGLVFTSSPDSTVMQDLRPAEGEQQDETIALRWQKWFAQVEQLPVSP